MATVTKTYTENNDGSYRSTWNFTLSASDITVTGSTFSLTAPTVTAMYTYSGKNMAEASIDSRVTIDGFAYWFTNSRSNGAWPSGTRYTLANSAASTISTSEVFTSSNKTTKSVAISYYVNSVWAWSSKSGSTMENSINQETFSPFSVVLRNVVLNAPPTFTSSQVSFDTSEAYTGLTTASVTVSDVVAQYGGDISSIKFTVGTQSTSVHPSSATGNITTETLSILLGQAGTFTPTVTVTDSRGQVTTKSLNPITVNGYSAPSVTFNVERTNSTGIPEDESSYAVISAVFSFTDAIATLSAPSVTVDGVTVNPTWYSTRAANGSLSGSVNWSSLSSPATVYALVNGNFNTQRSYTIGVTPVDNKGSGTEITQTLPSAFYTVDFLAGGHGVAFGQAATEEGFWCNMDTFSAPLIGSVQMYAGPTAPNGWLLCNGQAVSRTKYSALYNALGGANSPYGQGDGSTTFNLPNFCGRTPVGVGTSDATGATAHTLGQKAGEEAHTLTGAEAAQKAVTTGNMSANSTHYHRPSTISELFLTTAASTDIGVNDTKRAWPSSSSSGVNFVYRISGSGGISERQYTETVSTEHTHSIAASDATNAHNIMQPYLGINFIIHAGVPTN